MAKTKARNTKTTKSSKPKPAKVVYIKEPQMSIGAQIGDKLQKFGTSLFTRLMGTGDYTCSDSDFNISQNALMKGSQAKSVRMSADGKSTFIFEHSEYITDIISSSTAGAFNQQVFSVNPANVTTFPWLSNIALSFESYEIEGMIFRFVSSSGESVASTNTSIGTVMGVFQYDTLDPKFISKQQLLQYDDVVDCKASTNFLCGVECDINKIPVPLSRLFVGTPPTGADPKFYNYGNFVIATQGMQSASVNIGELWVSYRIKFHITKDSNFVQGSAHFSGNAPSSSIYSTPRTISGSLPIIAGPAANFLTINNLQVGATYLFSFSAYNSTASSWTTTSITTTGLLQVNYLRNNNASSTGIGTINSTDYVQEYTFTATAQTATISGSPWSTAPSTFYFDLYIAQLDSSILA
jgi:hypothetical protein